MIEIKSYLDDLEIMHSGQVHSFLESTIKISFDKMKIEIRFLKDSKLPVNIDYKVQESTLKIVFENYLDSNGSGIFTPWHIGNYDGRKLYITVFMQSVERSARTFIKLDYVLYLGKGDGNE